MRHDNWCIYTSSYDRGLEHLLKMWPQVIKQVPEAQLHVFYGWQLFEKFYHDNPASMAWKQKMDDLMTQPGITHHGRVPQPELKTWMEQCGIFAYPTHFGEISCISAMKAQAYGAIPVVIDYAALSTTVKYGKKVEGDIYEPETQKKYLHNLIASLKDSAWQDALRPQMMQWAQENFTWKQVAIDWTNEFKENL